MDKYVNDLREARRQKKHLKPYERGILRYEDLRDHFKTHLSNLLGAVEDVDKPLLSLKVIRREDGAFLAIAVRDDDMVEQVMFGYGDDFWEALLSINKKLNKGDWQESKPFTREEKPKKSKKG